ncbi:MAG TPA: porin [Xanthobacteraceae bacterium]|nr:porin [Xanthobacteraceae bacterium]
MQKLRLMMLALAGSALIGVACAPAAAKDGVSAGSDGITFKAANGDFELTLGGRLHLDAVKYDFEGDDDSDADVRRARVELSGKLGDHVRFRIDREFGLNSGWRNVWLAVRPTDEIEVRGGNFIVPFSMEEMQSSNRSQLMERSLVTALAPDFGLGGSVQYARRNWTATVGYFGDALDSEDEGSEDRGKGFAGRVTAAPILGKKQFLHLAAAIERRELDGGDALSFNAKPGSALAPTLISSGLILDADKMTNLDAEAAYSAGPFLLQGQYVRSGIDRPLLGDLDFDAWYAQASFIVTGESYDYARRSGTIEGVDLRRRKSAIELAARFSRLDMDDSAQELGRAQTMTLGANWYLNQNLRLMANYAHSTLKDRPLTDNQKVDLVTGRFQMNF